MKRKTVKGRPAPTTEQKQAQLSRPSVASELVYGSTLVAFLITVASL